MTVLRSIEEVAAVVAAAAEPHRRIIAGIVGPPGAGKSTLAEAVVARLDGAALLPMDGFHLSKQRLVELGRRDRMGAPDTFDIGGFATTIRDLRSPTGFGNARASGNSGKTVYAPGFDRTVEEAVPDAIAIGPEFPIVVVEGNYLLLDSDGWGDIAATLDLSVFVRLDRDIRLARLIDRHVRYGKTPGAARKWALGPDEANARLIDATSQRASHVVEL